MAIKRPASVTKILNNIKKQEYEEKSKLGLYLTPHAIMGYHNIIIDRYLKSFIIAIERDFQFVFSRLTNLT